MAFTRQLYKQPNGNNFAANYPLTSRQIQDQEQTNRSLRQRELAQDRVETERQGCEARAAVKRHNRELAHVEHDRAIEEAIIRAQAQKHHVIQQRDQEERLAMELERIKLDRFRETKMRQQIRETSNELRDLESKLRAGYIQKERTAQMAEKQASKVHSYLEDVEIVRCMRKETNRAEEDDRQRELLRQQQMIHYKHELEQQLKEQELAKQKAYEEFLRDKLIIDEVVRKIYDEDQREMEQKLERQRVTREYMIYFKGKREEWKAIERQRMEEENRRIKEYLKAREQQEEIVRAEKRARKLAFEKVKRNLGEKIQRDQEERDEEEFLRQELYFEEQEQAIRKRQHEEIETRIRKRLALQQDRGEQMQLTHWKHVALQQEEERSRQQLMAKYAEDDRIEQMNAQKRRMKQIEHKRAVDLLLEERRRKMALNKQNEMDERLEEERMEQVRKEIIEEERVKLLQEHAHRLLGYLPKGVIRNEKDLDYLGNDFKYQFKRQQINVPHPNGWLHQSFS